MKSKYLILAASLFGMAAANAATIAWSAVLTSPMGGGSLQSTLPTGIFSSIGTQILAENLGNPATGGAVALTFDGINFTTSTRQFATGGYDSGLADSGQNLINKGIYGNNDTVGTINLTGLTLGQQYRIQALVYDGRGVTTGRAVQFDGVSLGRYANGVSNVSWGPGLLVTGLFTASATTQSFTQAVFENTTYTVNKGQTMNALTLYAVPEPSSALLGGLGMLALLRRRR
jgi:hypothetical protein